MKTYIIETDNGSFEIEAESYADADLKASADSRGAVLLITEKGEA